MWYVCVLLCVSQLNDHHVWPHLLPRIAYVAKRVVTARYSVLCCVLNVRVWQHKLGYPLAVHCKVLERVTVPTSAIRWWLPLVPFVNSISILIMASCLAICCFFICACVHSSRMCVHHRSLDTLARGTLSQWQLVDLTGRVYVA